MISLSPFPGTFASPLEGVRGEGPISQPTFEPILTHFSPLFFAFDFPGRKVALDDGMRMCGNHCAVSLVFFSSFFFLSLLSCGAM